MLPNLGGWEWVIIAVVALVLFGGARLANFGKNAGRAIRDFKEEATAPVGPAANRPAEQRPVIDRSVTERPVSDGTAA